MQLLNVSGIVDVISVKHLNPRQGITTDEVARHLDFPRAELGVKHLNPRQGITTFDANADPPEERAYKRVKHLNPRQGITTTNSTTPVCASVSAV